MSDISKNVLLLAVLCAIFLMGAFFVTYKPKFTVSGTPTNVQTSEDVLIAKRQQGDYFSAVEAANEIIGDPAKSADEKARAVLGSAGAQFHITGNIADRLIDVRNLKSVVTNPEVALGIRVDALNRLASQYFDAGKDPVVFKEIFTGVPFEQYVVPNDPDQSVKQLYDWSYQQAPSTNAAIRIAQWYSDQFVTHRKSLNEGQIQLLTDKTEEYLKKADAALVVEKENIPRYETGTVYVTYRYFRTVVVGRLATMKGEPYKSQAQQAFTDYIQFAQNSPNVIAKEYLLFARYIFAARLMTGGDISGAQVQLKALSTEMGALDKPETHGFVRFLMNSQKNEPAGYNWTMVQELSKISPEFKAAVDTAVTAPRPEQNSALPQ